MQMSGAILLRHGAVARVIPGDCPPESADRYLLVALDDDPVVPRADIREPFIGVSESRSTDHAPERPVPVRDGAGGIRGEQRRGEERFAGRGPAGQSGGWLRVPVGRDQVDQGELPVTEVVGELAPVPNLVTSATRGDHRFASLESVMTLFRGRLQHEEQRGGDDDHGGRQPQPQPVNGAGDATAATGAPPLTGRSALRFPRFFGGWVIWRRLA